MGCCLRNKHLLIEVGKRKEKLVSTFLGPSFAFPAELCPPIQEQKPEWLEMGCGCPPPIIGCQLCRIVAQNICLTFLYFATAIADNHLQLLVANSVELLPKIFVWGSYILQPQVRITTSNYWLPTL